SSKAPMPTPEPRSTQTSCPRETSSCTLSGVRPTRYSLFLISRTVPTRMILLRGAIVIRKEKTRDAGAMFHRPDQGFQWWVDRCVFADPSPALVSQDDASG